MSDNLNDNLITTKDLVSKRVVDDVKGKRIGKVRRFVFHPSEKRCIGLLVKRPDAALMFHRKDLFVALQGFHLDNDGNLVVHSDSSATDKGAVKALGVDWDSCVIWVGMPVMTASGAMLGFVDEVAFDRNTGAVHSLTTENGAANDAILGKRMIPASCVKGFRKGQGAALVPAGEYQGETLDDQVERGAILVSDEALDIGSQGGVAAAAGKATAVATVKAKQGAVKAKKVVSKRVEDTKPGARKLAKAAGEAVESGSFAVGKQLGKASGMFAAFKEEFDKASSGEDD